MMKVLGPVQRSSAILALGAGGGLRAASWLRRSWGKWCAALFALALVSGVWAAPRKLDPAPSAVDNPMKGLVPFAGMHPERFPHSLEFEYIALAELMRGMDDFDWQPIERRLDAIASRGCQAIFRVWLEYPGRPGGMPEFLRREGVKLTEWTHDGMKSLTPDYTAEPLLIALERFIAAFGRRYDGDPRLGYLTAGLLGSWGEWHNFPREELFAPKSTQERILKAYEAAFRKTRVLLRYPAGEMHPQLAANAQRPFGYHDDSFAWGTLPSGRAQDAWFYLPSLAAAGAGEKWRMQPIGGEIRPEIWGLIFDEKPAHPKAQDFMECVRQTRVTWLMDSGLFREPPSAERIARASAGVRAMGYDFFASEVEIADGVATLTIRNNGVAPFYADWPLELAVLAGNGTVRHRWPVDWRLGGILPGESRTFRAALPDTAVGGTLAVRVINPLPGGKGKPLRFANTAQDADAPGWLTLGPL